MFHSIRCQGAKPVPLAAAVGLGVLLRFAAPIPAGITVQAWTLLSIFVSAIVGGSPLTCRPGWCKISMAQPAHRVSHSPVK